MTTASKDAVVTLHGEREFLERAGHLLVSAQEEFVCAAIDLNTWAMRQPRSLLDSLRSGVRTGLTVRKLYNPGALHDRRAVAHLELVASTGGQVRISTSTLAHETIIIDRRIAIIAGSPLAGRRDYTVVRAPEVVQGVYSLFSATWEAATELAEFRKRPTLPETSTQILRLLGSGQTDEAAARQLGLSIRTYRRRVAELMELLGADSRFQAGTRARALGLL